VARAVGRGSAGPGTELADYSEYDPLLGWRKRPGARLTFRRAEYSVPFAINGLGLRDEDRGYEAAPGSARILALGDSYVEGYSVEAQQTVTQVLERSLRQKGCAVDVINGGTTGYSTDQELLFFRTEGVKYAPAIVLLFFYYNDVLYNDRQFYSGGVSKPVFVFRQGRFELYKTPVPQPSTSPRAEAREERARPAPSALLEWVGERLWFGAPRTYNALGRLGLWPPNRPLGARLELRVYQKASIPEIEGAWQKTALILDTLAQEVASHGARLLVVYIPSRMETSESAWSLSQTRYGMTETGWDRELVVRRLSALARASQVPVLDLTPAMRAADHWLLGGPYWVQDGHWNASGHSVAAAEVERWMGESGWLAPCPLRSLPAARAK
jgi:hypothetical protein